MPSLNLLVLDDWGLAPMTAAEARDLLEVIDDRYQAHATIVATQLPVDQWYAIIADPQVADAILDRLVHNSHKLILKGESMRKSRRDQLTRTQVSTSVASLRPVDEFSGIRTRYPW